MATIPTSISDSRVWFITGSSQGLGKALLEAILSAGERAVATLRKPSALDDLKAKYSSSQLLILPLDVTSKSQIDDAFESIKKHFNRLDVVVNNAGYGLVGEIESTPDEEARKIMEVLFWGPVNIMKQAIKFFREVNAAGHGGRIFNISSVGGYQANPTLAFYSAGKFGCIIEPGGFRTEWSGASIVRLPQDPAYTDPSFPSTQYRSMHGTLRMIGDPARAAHVIFKLASEPDLPIRLQLGSDAFHLVKAQAKRTLSDQENWESVSHSTNADDYDRDIVSKIVSAIR